MEFLKLIKNPLTEESWGRIKLEDTKLVLRKIHQTSSLVP
jgi:uncharacterized linocin/CFP29 family protein